MSLPNVLTLLRIALTLGFLLCIQSRELLMIILAGICFVVAAVTDYYDGYYAKKFNKVTSTGKILDPIADKFLILSAFFIFMRMNLIALWMFVMIFVREVVVTGFRFYAVSRGQVLAAEMAGKCKTVLQMTSVVIMILFLIWQKWNLVAPWDEVSRVTIESIWVVGINLLMMLTVMMTLYSGLIYLWNNRKVFSTSSA